MILFATILSGVWALTHILLGGRQVERPLRSAPLSDVVRETALLVWHMLSFVLVFLTGLLGWTVMTGEVVTAWAGLILAAGLAMAGIGVQLWRGLSLTLLPQGWLFVPVAVATGWGLWA